MMVRRKLYSLILALSLVLCFVPVKTAWAANEGIVTISGLKEGDLVEIYRIANYSQEDEKYTWASAVSTWLADEKTLSSYQNMLPKDLTRMTTAESKRFCEVLLLNLKNDSTGVANLNGESFTQEVDGESRAELLAGYYIILPKGKQRVYELKWFSILPGGTENIEYLEADYSKATFYSNVEKVSTDRGKDAFENNPIVYLDDEVEVSSTINFPSFTEMYSPGKLVANLAVIIPTGMTYKDNSLQLKEAESLYDPEDTESPVEYSTLTVDRYTKQEFKNATLYTDRDDNLLFFSQGDYFYYMDGSNLKSSDSTAEAALVTYNSTYGTDYSLKTDKFITIYEDSDALNDKPTTKATEEESKESSEEGVVETTEIGTEEETVVTNDVYSKDGVTVIVISFDTDNLPTSVRLSVKATKNKYCSSNGWYDILSALTYSVSPLDTNRHCTDYINARTAAYGIRITAVKGLADSYLKTAEEIMEYATRMIDDQYVLYKKTAEYEGNVVADTELVESLGTAIEANLSNEPEVVADSTTEESTDESNSETTSSKKILVYKRSNNKTYEYTSLALLSVNSKGQISLAGIEPTEYMIVQTKHSPGFSLSAQSLIIEPDDWQNKVTMESNTLFDVIWFDFKTVYLPATGSYGTENTITYGVLLGMFALIILSRSARKRFLI